MTALLRLWIEGEYRFPWRGNSRAASGATPSSQLSTANSRVGPTGARHGLHGLEKRSPSEPRGSARRAMLISEIEPQDGGVLIRPALLFPVEVYTPERKAQFILSSAFDAADYAGAVEAVRAMGLDPKTIPHFKPPPGF
jgi:hypothetical protein